MTIDIELKSNGIYNIYIFPDIIICQNVDIQIFEVTQKMQKFFLYIICDITINSTTCGARHSLVYI